MDDYIKVSNTKRYGVYRDIIIPEEYDPLTPHEAIIHYANPTKYDARNYGAIRRNSLTPDVSPSSSGCSSGRTR